MECSKGEDCCKNHGEEAMKDCECSQEGHSHGEHRHANPLEGMDQETQQMIQELQILEQQFQQLLMQKNAFNMESNEVKYTIEEVEKTKGEVSRILGNQVVIKSTKEEVLRDLKKKKELIEKRLEAINSQEKEFSEKMEGLRTEVMKKISA